MNYKLSPSNLTFQYAGCKRCFYLKMVKGITQLSMPLPSTFSKIAGLLKNHYAGKPTSELHVNLSPGIVSHDEKLVRSRVIQLPNHKSTCYINGRFDIAISFDDDTYRVIDFKSSKPTGESAWMYSCQLHTYAYTLEHPADGTLSLSPVTTLGLVYFYPDDISQDNIARLNYDAEIVWVEIEKDEEGFLNFIDGVLDVLKLPKAPKHSPSCQWCGYIARLNST